MLRAETIHDGRDLSRSSTLTRKRADPDAIRWTLPVPLPGLQELRDALLQLLFSSSMASMRRQVFFVRLWSLSAEPSQPVLASSGAVRCGR